MHMCGHLGSLLVLAGLRVTTSTPDALCPPVGAAKEAISSRVGEIRGADFLAEYRVVRGATAVDGSLELVLKSADGEVLLERNLPLDEISCADAATVLAMLLERYFEGLRLPAENQERSETENSQSPMAKGTAGKQEHPSPSTGVKSIERTPEGSGKDDPSDPDTMDSLDRQVPKTKTDPSPRADETESPAPLNKRWAFGLHTKATLAQVPLLGVQADYLPQKNWLIHAFASFALREQTILEENTTGNWYGAWFGAGLRYRLDWGHWSATVGPTLAFLMQRAQLDESSDIEASGSGARALAAVGVDLSIRRMLAPTWQAELGIQGGPFLPIGARRFGIEEPDGNLSEILTPPGFFLGGWLGILLWP